MSINMKRRMGWALAFAGVVLAGVSVTVLTWPLGLVVGMIAATVGGLNVVDNPPRRGEERSWR